LPLFIARYSRRALATEEAFPAKHRPALGRLEGHRGFPTALRAGGHGLGFVEARSWGTLALGLTGFAPFGFVLKVLVVEEVLFSRCENKICSAVYAFEDAVLKLRHIHCFPRST
jgi:hypothetical protein